MTTMTRRELLKASTTAGLVLSAPALASAQGKEPITIGTLSPLTGAGGSYGPDMQRAVVAVVERISPWPEHTPDDRAQATRARSARRAGCRGPAR